jgi:hypothetical protein
MTTPAADNDLTTLDADQLIGRRAALRARLATLPGHDEQRAELEDQYEQLTDEFDRRAGAAWRLAAAALRDQSFPRSPPTTSNQPPKGPTVESTAGTGNELHEFERTYFERLRLAAQVILDAAPDLELVTDPLEAELHIFKERTEFLLLLPEYAGAVIPWRRMLNGEPRGTA